MAMEFYSKEIQIMRQSQSKMALEFTKSHNLEVTITELERITQLFIELCLRPQDEDLKKRMAGLDKWIKEKKLEKNK